ncbi:MAG: SDR family oxidoreductase [Chloroflexi bacterium]|nr:SDR family oxidoreductase [Chloroflexota bacterium]
MNWTANDLPDLRNRTVIVTGANSGVGFESARGLAQHGATVVMACRDEGRGQRAADAIRAGQPDAALAVMPLDLADLSSVRRFADAFTARHDRLDVLLNNAGVMAIPYRTTADGFEMQFGTNHLGHFALTGRLLDALRRTPGARVVVVSSGMHRRGRVAFDDLQSKRAYSRYGAYGQSKLANLLFAYELNRRFAANGVPAIGVGAHPGYAATNLQTAGARMDGARMTETITNAVTNLVAQSSAMGALPLMYAAAAPGVSGGDYIGPTGLAGMRGYPGQAKSSTASHSRADAARLWESSEQLTGVSYNLPPAP